MRVLITGITGFIGGHLAERLLSEGVAVRGLARQPEAAAWLAKLGARSCLATCCNPPRWRGR